MSPPKMNLFGSAKNYSLGSATMAGHIQVPITQGKEKAFYEEVKDVCSSIVNNESMAFYWVLCNLFNGGFGLLILSYKVVLFLTNES